MKVRAQLELLVGTLYVIIIIFYEALHFLSGPDHMFLQ